MARLSKTPRTILVADDSHDDVFFFRRAIRDVCGREIVVVRDGQECIDYLSNCSSSSGGNPRPDLIILDIKMPLADGHEVLAWLRAQPRLKHIPVVIMTGSVRPEDRTRSLSAGARAFFSKPSDLSEIVKIVKQCGRQWNEWRENARADDAADA